MNTAIMKFGGTSVADSSAFMNVAQIVISYPDLRPVIVVSAMRGMTDALLASVEWARSGPLAVDAVLTSLHPQFQRHSRVAADLSNESSSLLKSIDDAQQRVAELLHSVAKTPAAVAALRDEIVSFGERLSTELMAAVLREKGVNALTVDSRSCIKTDEIWGCATPLMAETIRCTQTELRLLLERSVIPVLGGFIGSTLSGKTTTLGRGGSDYTAALIGAALSASEIQIWTDVTGVLTADPRLVTEAETIPRLSYAEAAELAYFGAKVLHPKTIQPAVEGLIPLRICNSRAPREPGTIVGIDTDPAPQTVKAIAHKTGITTVQITSARMLGAYGFLRALFEIFDRYTTAVDVVTTSEVSVSLSLDDTRMLPSIVQELQLLGEVNIEKSRAIVCVVGEGLRATAGIAARIFSTISDINVSLISQGASSINLTFAVEQAHVAEAVNRLHQEFFQRSKRPHSMEKVAGGAEVRY